MAQVTTDREEYERGFTDAIRTAVYFLELRDDDWSMWNQEAIIECARYISTIDSSLVVE